LKSSRSRLLEDIQQILDNSPFPPCKIEVFGSTATNLAFERSDVDLTIISDTPDHPLRDVRKIAKLLRKAGKLSVSTVRNARVPICKFYDPVSKLNCDVNFGHFLGVYNSSLIRTYTFLDPRVKPLLLLVKSWSKVRDLNNPSSGGMMLLMQIR
jgi:DNA polymerase sigma